MGIRMVRKTYTPEQIIIKLREAEVLILEPIFYTGATMAPR